MALCTSGHDGAERAQAVPWWWPGWSTSRAADELRVAQPSLSRTIARLEKRAGRTAVRPQRPAPAE
ncbi:LysR family transcriptional regulator [Streptomyces tricolor]|nr:LysR family transcriptional regulator [Streptomyces tricolor]